MHNTNYIGSGWIWPVIIIFIILITFLLIWWAFPSSCNSCNALAISGIQNDETEHIYIDVAPKDKNHPHFGKGNNQGYVVNGEQGKVLELSVGKKYRFICRTENFPLHFVRNEEGKGESLGITGTPAANASFPFVAEVGTPQPLYYGCVDGGYMGAPIIIVN